LYLCQVDGDMWRTAKLVDSVELPYIAPSLGGCESLIEQPTIVSYWDQVSANRYPALPKCNEQDITHAVTTFDCAADAAGLPADAQFQGACSYERQCQTAEAP